MGVDCVLCMEVVLANGEIVQASENLQPDLFWALRGGGACNFGILSYVTYKLLPPLTDYGDLYITVSADDDDQFKEMLTIIFSYKILVEQWFGGFIIFMNYPKGAGGGQRTVVFYLNYGNISFEKIINNYVNPFVEKLKNIGIKVNVITSTDETKDTNDFFSEKVGFARNRIVVSKQPNSTLNKGQMLYTPSKERWWTYESYDDYIVGFGSRYLIWDDVKAPEKCADKFIAILKLQPWISLEISKGLYGAPEEILKINEKTSVNPKVRKAVGLVYIRSYLEHFNPNIIQPFEVLKKVKFKYESHPLIFPEWNKKIEEFSKIGDNTIQNKALYDYIMEGAKISKGRLDEAVNLMRSTLLGNATYINHSDCGEPNWWETFWGKKNLKNWLI